MKTPELAKEVAHRMIKDRFPSCDVAFCAGSFMRGEGTEHSDIDLVVIFADLKAAWRESFLYESWPIEAFVHDASTLRYFCEEIDVKSGVPSLPQMINEGFQVWGDPAASEKYKQMAKAILANGPPPLTSDEVHNLIYGITDLIDDLRTPRSKGELFGTAARLYDQLGNFALRSKGNWSGTGKHLARSLQKSGLHHEFVGAFEKLFSEADPAAVIALTEKIVAPFGGFHFDGYRRVAPASWRKDVLG